MRARWKILCGCVAGVVLCSPAPGDDKLSDKNAESAGQILASVAKAYNARDAKGLADQFTSTGEFIDADGNVFEGREAISREFTALFEINPPNRVEIAAGAIREISPGVLSVHAVATFSGEKGPDSAKVDFAALVAKQADGRWLLASIRSERDRSLRIPRAQLKQLEWLVGDWVDESSESTAHVNTRWSDDGNFLITNFAIQAAGRKVRSGTQWIGWDGSLRKFRSWVFDSDGGHGQGIWSESGDRWIVKATGVRADGGVFSATQTYNPQGQDAYLFSVTDRIVGDEPEADFTSHVVRKPPDPGGGAKAAAAPRGKGAPVAGVDRGRAQ